ncbi:CubicO group peptidase (beta-lactamase class C family) [Mycetocola sp. BIGb0189]|uniref:serine hydrolase domain-containing protein n=1 Tax=Mycetocola sp. BIGb0189 TaxID=2940604 RepID=UPI0021683497|nr:serine hydrolase domain-containing protein [Mycetocola sp. BIGb0189]MCS4276180.1 CubicO group peptidase (beta-lactamase class C family) [Mycetocola sp. BIGb0189]
MNPSDTTAADTTASRTDEITDTLRALVRDPASVGVPGRIPGSALALAGLTPSGERVDFLHGRTAIAEYEPEISRPLGPEHRFDFASLSKLFVSVAALSVVESGLVDPDAPIGDVLGESLHPDARRITLMNLLAHDSGLPANTRFWEDAPDADALWTHVLGTAPVRAPGEAHEYSCIGYNILGRILETVTGEDLPTLLHARVLEPLGTRGTGYHPIDPGLAVATEEQPGRGLVRGSVHDELSFFLGRPSGNSGLFGPADDALALGRMILADGLGDRGRVLSPASVALLAAPQIHGTNAAGCFGQAVGFRVHDAEFMGAVPGLGHTGFTGTMLVVDPVHNSAVALLTNRVHPGRARANVFAVQRLASETVCLAGVTAG